MNVKKEDHVCETWILWSEESKVCHSKMTDSTENKTKQTADEGDLNYWLGRWQANKIGFHRIEIGR